MLKNYFNYGYKLRRIVTNLYNEEKLNIEFYISLK